MIVSPEQSGLEAGISNIVEWLRLTIETSGAIIIAYGFLASLWLLLSKHTGGFNGVRLRLATYLALALEFQLAADILSTAVAPTWDKIGKLGAIAIIRTALNYFLMKELAHERNTADAVKT
jgi:uncharacterized membrane protein